MNLNKFIGVGRITAEPELKALPDGTSVVKFSIAINDKYKSRGEYVEDVLFVEATLFGASAESFVKFHNKGNQVLVEGKLRIEKWENNGQKYQKLVLRDVTWGFADNNRQESQQETNYQQSNNSYRQPAPAQNAVPPATQYSQRNDELPANYDPFADDDFVPKGESPI